MANTLIQILRSYNTAVPATLQDGQLAYSFQSDKLFIGNSAGQVFTIGGKHYTDIIDAATTNATPDTLVLRDANGAINVTSVITAGGVGASDLALTGSLTVGTTSSFGGNVISDLKVTTDIYANNAYISNDISAGRDVTIGRNLNVLGDLSVQGTVTTINSTTVTVEDKNLALGNTAAPTDIGADGGGITLYGDTEKTLNWVLNTDSWTSSENFDLASGKAYKIDGSDVLTSSALITQSATFDLANTNATTVNAFGAATSVKIGAETGVTEVRNDLLANGSVTIEGGSLIANSAIFDLANNDIGTVNAFGATDILNIGAADGATYIKSTLSVDGATTINNTLDVVGQTTVGDLHATGDVVFDNALTVPNGGTGITSATLNGVVFGNGTDPLQVTAAGTEGQVLMVGVDGVPYFSHLDGGTF